MGRGVQIRIICKAIYNNYNSYFYEKTPVDYRVQDNTLSEAYRSFKPNLTQCGRHYSQYANYPAQFVYSRSQLLSIHFSSGKIKPGGDILGKLKEFSLLKYRGNHAGRGSGSGLRIPTLILQDRKNANQL